MYYHPLCSRERLANRAARAHFSNTSNYTHENETGQSIHSLFITEVSRPGWHLAGLIIRVKRKIQTFWRALSISAFPALSNDATVEENHNTDLSPFFASVSLLMASKPLTQYFPMQKVRLSCRNPDYSLKNSAEQTSLSLMFSPIFILIRMPLHKYWLQ